MEATVDWVWFNNIHISAFVSLHTWRSGVLSQEGFAQIIEKETSFMRVVVNKNIYTSLKVMNEAEFSMADIIADLK